MLERLTKLSLAVGASLYVIGFMVNALYLARYGVSPLGLVRAQYVLAGVWTILPLALIAMAVSVIAYAVWDARNDETQRPALMIGIGLTSIGAVIGWASQHLSLGDRPAWLIGRWLLSAAIYGVFIALTAGAAVSVWNDRPAGDSGLRTMFTWIVRASGMASLAAIFAVGYISWFATRVYPNIPATLGGGEPTRATIVFKAPVAVSGEYPLLLADDKTLVILRGKDTISLSRNDVASITITRR